MIVYHGSTMVIKNPDTIHSKGFLDFGPGFYVTTYKEQAERWAFRKGMRRSMPAIVNAYDHGELSEYHIKQFTDTDTEWLKFVCDCRNGKEVYKGFDAIIGNVANDDVFKCVSMYMDNIWDEERTLQELKFYKTNDQIAFLTQDIIDHVLSFREFYEVQP